MSGGGGGGFTSILPMAAALAATVATDGAASPWLVEAMGSEAAAGAIMGAGAGALGGGITAAITGQNVGQSALMGGIGGATLGYGMAPGATEAVTGATTAPALTGSNVAGSIAAPQASAAMGELATAPTAAGGFSPYAEALGSNAQTTAGNLGTYWDAIGQSGNAPVLSNASNATLAGATGVSTGAAGAAGAAGAGGIGSTLGKYAPYALGATALGSLMKADNKKYGTPTAASQEYNGPLSKLHYDPNNYTPITTDQPNPAYKPTYANYVAHPYNAYAAEGGEVHSYADGGLLQGGPANVNFMGSDMYPQSQQQRSYYATPTQMPTSAQQTMASYEPKTNPLTGEPSAGMARGGIAQTKRYADGGTAETTQAPQQPQPPQTQVPSLVNFAPFAGRYGVNEAPTQNAVAQDLVSRLAMRNAMNPVPGQTPPVAPAQPAGIMAAPYSPPTFTRPDVVPVEFQNPAAIRGTKEYNDAQAAAAAAQAQMAAMGNGSGSNYSTSGGGGDGGGDGGGEAAGGLMRSYAVGGKTTNNMAAIDDYVAQYQTDPAGVTAKAKSGDYNAMIALNKINKTPNQNYAAGGGIGHLGSYSDGGRMLKGPGDGMSDNIPATIGGKQPARLADGEFVVPADVVSHLGNGSTDAGAKHLYAMMDRVRKARTGNKKQGKQIKADKFLKV